MKSKTVLTGAVLLALFANRGFAPPPLTAFTYQGSLTEAGFPANGFYDFRLAVFDAETLGSTVGERADLIAVPVSNGLFTFRFDPGEGVFDGSPRWLQIGVRTNGGGSLRTLTPRQEITAAPQAQFAINAAQATSLIAPLPATQLTGTLPDARLSGNVALLNTSPTFQGEVRATRFAGDGGGLTNLNAATLGGLTSGSFWQLNGNAGTTPGTQFLGTSDNQPLEVRVNNSRALRLIPQANGVVQIIAGHQSNEITGAQSAGSVIAGGGREPQISYDPRDRTWTTNYRHQVISAPYCNIGGGFANTIQAGADQSVISGGYGNLLGSNVATSVIAGGFKNQILAQTFGYAPHNTIGGGWWNIIETNALDATIAGGNHCTIGAASQESTIGGGSGNMIQAEADYCMIAGGSGNMIRTNADHATIGGGVGNTVGTNAQNATIPGGKGNEAWGTSSFAVGQQAHALHDGAFVWGDATQADIASTNANSVTIRAGGGYRFFSDTNASTGVFLAAGGGSWTAMSDRNAKESFVRVDAREVLEKVTALPVETWNYKSQDAAVRHIGPMAQDFKNAFGVGETDTGITSVDADGVALAAIQGLNLKLEEQLREKDALLKTQQQQISELLKRLDALERSLSSKL